MKYNLIKQCDISLSNKDKQRYQRKNDMHSNTGKIF